MVLKNHESACECNISLSVMGWGVFINFLLLQAYGKFQLRIHPCFDELLALLVFLACPLALRDSNEACALNISWSFSICSYACDVFKFRQLSTLCCSYKALGIRLDSGDLAYLSKQSRRVFSFIEKEFGVPGFESLVITASNDINEETLEALNKQVGWF